MSGAHAERLARLRAELKQQGVDGFFLPRTDEHGSEYLPPDAERVAWLTGFTGSAAQVVVLPDNAAVFSDGRYTVQLAEQVDEALFERRHVVEHPPARWLEENLTDGAVVGFDPFLVRQSEQERLAKAVAPAGGRLVPLARNPVDAIWAERPPPPTGIVAPLEEQWAGASSAEKRARIAGEIAKRRADWLVLTSADSIAWLLNIRGSDIPFNPLCLSHALLKVDGTCRWFVEPQKLPADLRLDNAIAVEPQAAFGSALGSLGNGVRVLVDPQETHLGFLEAIRAGGAVLVEGQNPVLLAKATKNEVEIKGAIEAQRRDGAAVVRFLAWLDRQPLDGSLDEIKAAQALEAERARDPRYRGESFPAISAHGPHAALPHYRTEPGRQRPLTAGAVYLIDSGGQYLDATTDITRTVALGEVPAEVAQRFTLVLKGHIALSQALFPVGTTGAQLDTLARQALWRHGLDFDHGTSHGVGAYLCVHEGPARISKSGGGVALKPGMILSNEPGYYKADAYGIRIENLVLVEERPMPEGGERQLMGFRILTLCPIDRRLIVAAMLTPDERAWVDHYHARVGAELASLVGEARPWLAAACAPL